jgi:hypothetical protein
LRLESEQYGTWIEACGEMYLFGNRPVEYSIIVSMHIIEKLLIGKLGNKRGNLLLSGNAAIGHRQQGGTTLSKNSDKKLLETKSQLLDGWNHARV